MNDRNRLEMLNYWLENTEEIGKIPQELKNKIKEGDVTNLFLEIESKKDGITERSDIMKYRDKILDRLLKEKEINLLEDTTLSNKILVLATIIMALTSIFSVNIGFKQLEAEYQKEIFDIQKNEPLLGFNIAPCIPFPMMIGSGGTSISSFFVLQNIGNNPLAFEFEIKSDFAKFKLINETNCDFSIPCCSDYLNECKFKMNQKYQILLPQKPQLFKYMMSVPGSAKENFNYSINVLDLYHNNSVNIMTCNYTFTKNLENFGMKDVEGYAPN